MRQSTIAAVFYALIPLGAALAEDSLSRYDDVVISAAVIDKCHLVIPGIINYEKLEADGKAAFNEEWQSLDAQGGDHSKNGQTADFTLKKRTEAAVARGNDLVATKGCDSLIPHAREVLESYRQ